MEAHLNQKMIATAQKTIVLADSSKFGKRGFGRICGLEEVDEIITDKGVSSHILKTMEDMGIKVTLV
jgi:DeoR family transcriptional regulator of aga operon